MAVAFGTSGLRGPAEDFTLEICDAYVSAFLERVAQASLEKTVYLAGDLRASTPLIASHCAASAKASGWNVVWAGSVSTPALAHYALSRQAPAIMVTGSHIPEAYNGIKFYRPDGEFLKEDEEPVGSRAKILLAKARQLQAGEVGAPDPAIAAAYGERYLNAFGPNALAGLHIGIDLHSAVGRDDLVKTFRSLGAEVLAFRRSDHFIAVDTEALDPDDVARSAAMIAENNLDAVVSTDGDGDRPLVIDDTGKQINGDVLGALTARALAIKTVVTPLSSTSAIEQSNWFDVVERTRIGSPHVVAAMGAASLHPVAGFEANGGFLLEDDLELEHGSLKRLPTRDALLPAIAVLVDAKARSTTLSALAATLPARFMRADRVKDVARDAGAAFLQQIAGSADFRKAFDARIASPVTTDQLDGVRMQFEDGSTIHFRQSGNAPEMRCYVETSNEKTTQALLAAMMARLKAQF